MSQKVYETVTKLIREALENGVAPWNKPWSGSDCALRATGKPYRGFNQLLLSYVRIKNSYPSNIWLTENQIQKLGGQIRGADYGEDYKENKRKHGVPVIYAEWKIKEEQQPDGSTKKKTFPISRWYLVYNVSVTDLELKNKLPANLLKKTAKEIVFSPIESAQKIVNEYKTKPEIRSIDQRAYYHPKNDFVNMPKAENFNSAEDYHSVLFHELIHSTGAKHRLNRATLIDAAPFGSEVYSQEELVAEMGAAYLCGMAGIENKTIGNSASYIKGWLKALNNDPLMLVKAASQAEKACDYILGKEEEKEEKEEN